jgi:hypothetical protein
MQANGGVQKAVVMVEHSVGGQVDTRVDATVASLADWMGYPKVGLMDDMLGELLVVDGTAEVMSE